MASVAAYVTSQLTLNGLSASEAASVTTALQALPAFQWSAWLWAVDTSTISPAALATIWGFACWETVLLIDSLEHGHWSRSVFASQAIKPGN